MTTSIVKATIWSAFQRFGMLVISFVSNIILARLLMPEDYGLVALITVFVGFADVLVDGGLGNALIQKKDIKEIDIKTVYTLNLLMSIILYGILFFSAPSISRYCELPQLTICLRVLAINIIIKGLYVVHFSLISRDLDFKRLSVITVFGQGISTLIAILMAYSGYGVWSLIIRTVLQELILLIFYYCNKGFVSIGFGKDSFRQLFAFGVFVAISSIIGNLYNSVLSFIIGKRYSVRELGYYNQAYGLQQVPVFSMSCVVNQVFFPFFSTMQDDIASIRRQYFRSINIVTFFIYPILAYLVFFGHQIVVFLYTEKWLNSALLFQILCLSGFFNVLMQISNSTIKALGRSREYFYINVISIVCGLAITFLFINYRIGFFVYSVVLTNILFYFVSGFYLSKYIDLNLFRQVIAFAPNMLISFVSTAIVTWGGDYIKTENLFLEIIITFISSIGLYFIIHSALQTSSFKEIRTLLNSKMHKN